MITHKNWTAGEYVPNDGIYISGYNGANVRTIIQVINKGGYSQEIREMAALVASAPDMLEALKLIVEKCERRLQDGADTGDQETLKTCQEAIARATLKSK